jgi:hypothetical protein
MPPKPCNRKDLLWPPVLEQKWSFNLCKYVSRPVKKVLDFFIRGNGGKAVPEEAGKM